MTHSDLIDLDHLMIGVESHEAAIAAFTKLGFLHRSVRHLPPMGGGVAGGVGGSAVVMLRPLTDGAANFLELAYLDEPYAQPFMLPILKDVVGATMLVHGTRDAAALHGRWKAAGLDLLPLVELSIGVAQGGEDAGQDLKIIIPTGDQPVWCNACQYSTVSEFMIESLMDHPNGAVSWTGVVIVADDSVWDQTSDHLQVVYGADPANIDGGIRFQPSGLTIDMMSLAMLEDQFGIKPSVDEARPRIALVRVSVSDLNQTQAVLDANGAQYTTVPSGLVAEASGLFIAFEPMTSA
ncbi:MAG: VOC family protein [Pseudomonadota bacterium]